MQIAEDIYEKIKKDFRPDEMDEVINLLKKTVGGGLNVGEGQFIRSLLFLANGNVQHLKKKISNMSDPRDIVGEAEMKSGDFGHWFSIPFDEIAQLIQIEIKKMQEDQDSESTFWKQRSNDGNSTVYEN